MLILFLVTSHLKRLLTFTLIKLFENTETVEGFSKTEFKKLLSLATKESC